jgi:site-specific recombinase XerD
MSYRTKAIIKLKNINSKNIGVLNIEITFTHVETKKRVRKYVNTMHSINADQFGKNGIKTNNNISNKPLKILVEKKLQEIEELLHTIELKNGEITPALFDQTQQISDYAKMDILELYDIFLKYMKRKIDHRTYQKYCTLKNHLKQHISESVTTKVYAHDISTEFLENFEIYLFGEDERENSTVNKYQSCLNTFLDYVTKKLHVNANLDYRDYELVSRKNESGSKVFLLKEHVERIINYQTDNEKHEKVKDLFIFSILTGVRYSDLCRINKSFVKGKILQFRMFKTLTDVNIPLHKKAIEILKKYDYKISEICNSIKDYNVVLKELCKKAGLTETVSQLKIYNTSKVDQESFFYENISSHVARNTFVTNCLIAGIPIHVVMSFTGHKKMETLRYYAKIAESMTEDAIIRYDQYFDFS